MTDDKDQERKALLEAALFLSEDPLSTDKLADILNLGSKGYVSQLVDKLRQDFEKEGRGITIEEREGKYDMAVKQDYLNQVAHLAPHQDIPSATLRTLALIAYNHPIKQSRVVDIRGNRAYSQVKELKKRGLVKAEKDGRTKVLRVTQDFLDYFGLETAEEFKMHLSQEAEPIPEEG